MFSSVCGLFHPAVQVNSRRYILIKIAGYLAILIKPSTYYKMAQVQIKVTPSLKKSGKLVNGSVELTLLAIFQYRYIKKLGTIWNMSYNFYFLIAKFYTYQIWLFYSFDFYHLDSGNCNL
jgi:hypothetical protein